LRNVAFRLSCEYSDYYLRNFYVGKTGCYKPYLDNRTFWYGLRNPRPWELPSACVGVVNPRHSCLTLGPLRNLVSFRACPSYNIAFFVDLGRIREERDWALAQSRIVAPCFMLMEWGRSLSKALSLEVLLWSQGLGLARCLLAMKPLSSFAECFLWNPWSFRCSSSMSFGSRFLRFLRSPRS